MSDQAKQAAVLAMCQAFRELNEIRARDGVPWTSFGYRATVDANYFSQVVDDLDAAVLSLTGKSAHCHPCMYPTNP